MLAEVWGCACRARREAGLLLPLPDAAELPPAVKFEKARIIPTPGPDGSIVIAAVPVNKEAEAARAREGLQEPRKAAVPIVPKRDRVTLERASRQQKPTPSCACSPAKT